MVLVDDHSAAQHLDNSLRQPVQADTSQILLPSSSPSVQPGLQQQVAPIAADQQAGPLQHGIQAQHSPLCTTRVLHQEQQQPAQQLSATAQCLQCFSMQGLQAPVPTAQQHAAQQQQALQEQQQQAWLQQQLLQQQQQQRRPGLQVQLPAVDEQPHMPARLVSPAARLLTKSPSMDLLYLLTSPDQTPSPAAAAAAAKMEAAIMASLAQQPPQQEQEQRRGQRQPDPGAYAVTGLATVAAAGPTFAPAAAGSAISAMQQQPQPASDMEMTGILSADVATALQALDSSADAFLSPAAAAGPLAHQQLHPQLVQLLEQDLQQQMLQQQQQQHQKQPSVQAQSVPLPGIARQQHQQPLLHHQPHAERHATHQQQQQKQQQLRIAAVPGPVVPAAAASAFQTAAGIAAAAAANCGIAAISGPVGIPVPMQGSGSLSSRTVTGELPVLPSAASAGQGQQFVRGHHQQQRQQQYNKVAAIAGSGPLGVAAAAATAASPTLSTALSQDVQQWHQGGSGRAAGSVDAADQCSTQQQLAQQQQQQVLRHTRQLTCKTYLKRLNVTQYMSDNLLPRMEGSLRVSSQKQQGSAAAAAAANRGYGGQQQQHTSGAGSDDDYDPQAKSASHQRGAAVQQWSSAGWHAGGVQGYGSSGAASGANQRSYEMLFKVQVKLVDAAGQVWPVTYEGVLCAGQRHLRLTCGWSEFIKAHKLAIGDAIMFERRGSNRTALAVAIQRSGQEAEQVFAGVLPADPELKVLVGSLSGSAAAAQPAAAAQWAMESAVGSPRSCSALHVVANKISQNKKAKAAHGRHSSPVQKGRRKSKRQRDVDSDWDDKDDDDRYGAERASSSSAAYTDGAAASSNSGFGASTGTSKHAMSSFAVDNDPLVGRSGSFPGALQRPAGFGEGMSRLGTRFIAGGGNSVLGSGPSGLGPNRGSGALLPLGASGAMTPRPSSSQRCWQQQMWQQQQVQQQQQHQQQGRQHYQEAQHVLDQELQLSSWNTLPKQSGRLTACNSSLAHTRQQEWQEHGSSNLAAAPMEGVEHGMKDAWHQGSTSSGSAAGNRRLAELAAANRLATAASIVQQQQHAQQQQWQQTLVLEQPRQHQQQHYRQRQQQLQLLELGRSSSAPLPDALAAAAAAAGVLPAAQGLLPSPPGWQVSTGFMGGSEVSRLGNQGSPYAQQMQLETVLSDQLPVSPPGVVQAGLTYQHSLTGGEAAAAGTNCGSLPRSSTVDNNGAGQVCLATAGSYDPAVTGIVDTSAKVHPTGQSNSPGLRAFGSSPMVPNYLQQQQQLARRQQQQHSGLRQLLVQPAHGTGTQQQQQRECSGLPASSAFAAAPPTAVTNALLDTTAPDSSAPPHLMNSLMAIKLETHPPVQYTQAPATTCSVQQHHQQQQLVQQALPQQQNVQLQHAAYAQQAARAEGCVHGNATPDMQFPGLDNDALMDTLLHFLSSEPSADVAMLLQQQQQQQQP